MMIPWSRLQRHFAEELALIREKMDTATDLELFRLQGEARRLKQLLNLPETLKILDEKPEPLDAPAGTVIPFDRGKEDSNA